ncbi:hypothetical protein B9J07_06450 [Sinorhizobium sp. LM21]|nr:hypothetical protein B9J07_06450 [Sinorhizobium sp. LM21]
MGGFLFDAAATKGRRLRAVLVGTRERSEVDQADSAVHTCESSARAIVMSGTVVAEPTERLRPVCPLALPDE